jgi:hypothetical protein
LFYLTGGLLIALRILIVLITVMRLKVGIIKIPAITLYPKINIATTLPVSAGINTDKKIN